MPDIVFPRRRYPIYIYFYAVVIYVLYPKMTQREAARNTRLCFGLATFSASTLCRILKKLMTKVCELAVVFGKDTDGHTCGDDDEDCAKAILRGIEILVNEDSLSTPACDEEEKAPDAPAVPVKETLKDVLNTPYLKGFIDKLKTKKPGYREKVGFAEYIGRCCRKYFLLNRSLLI